MTRQSKHKGEIEFHKELQCVPISKDIINIPVYMNSSMDDLMRCSVCGVYHLETYGKCPLCGAKTFFQNRPNRPDKSMLREAYITYKLFHEMASMKYDAMSKEIIIDDDSLDEGETNG